MEPDTTHRRSSGRARKPTAKLEALAGTKLNPTGLDTTRMTNGSQSPGPSTQSVTTTPVSPQFDSFARPDDAASVVSDTPFWANDDNYPMSAQDIKKRESRRNRKPTKRAIEAEEVIPVKKRQRRSKGDRSSVDATSVRVSATPSEADDILDKEVVAPTTPSNMASRDRPSNADSLPDTDEGASRTKLSDKTTASISKDVEAMPKEAEATKSSVSSRKIKPHEADIPEDVVVKAERENSSKRPVRGTRRASSADKRASLPAWPTEGYGSAEKTESEPVERSTPEVDEHPAAPSTEPATTTSARRFRKSKQVPEVSPIHLATEESTVNSPDEESGRGRPKRSTQKRVSYAPVRISPEAEENDLDVRSATVRRAPRRSSAPSKSALESEDVVGKELPAQETVSPPLEEQPRKSLKIVLQVAHPKMPRVPSKLRFFVSAQEEPQRSPIDEQPAQAEPPKKRAKPSATTGIRPTIEQGSPQQETIPRKVKGSTPKSSPTTKTWPENMSRRAQAKAEAQMMSGMRAAMGLNQPYQSPPAPQSYYAPSVRLMSPSMGCNLFCLDPASRLLAFAQIAAESNESDEEETSENGKTPQLYDKWLEKGRPRFCVCDKPSHAHAHSMRPASSEEGNLANSTTGGIVQTENADVAAAIPENTTLPISVPPVNSIMRKSQGRRVSALYNVLTTSSSSGGSSSNSATNASHTRSSVSHSPGLDALNGNPSLTGHAHGTPPAARPFEERMRWDQQMLERIRREARELGIGVTLQMTYNEIKTRIDEKRGHESGVSTPSNATNGEGPDGRAPNGHVLAKNSDQIQVNSPGGSAESINEIVDSEEESVSAGVSPEPASQVVEDDDDRLLAIIGDIRRSTAKSHHSTRKPKHDRSSGYSQSMLSRSHSHGANHDMTSNGTTAQPSAESINPAKDGGVYTSINGFGDASFNEDHSSKKRKATFDLDEDEAAVKAVSPPRKRRRAMGSKASNGY